MFGTLNITDWMEKYLIRTSYNNKTSIRKSWFKFLIEASIQ